MKKSMLFQPGHFSLEQMRAIYQQMVSIELAVSARAGIDASTQEVTDIIVSQRTAYGINTGFGLLVRTSIPTEPPTKLQRNLILSHCTGNGPLLDDATASLILVPQVSSLARGFSCISFRLIDALIKLYQAKVYPCIPSQGSIGASGDLAPLAHMSSVLIGVGRVHHLGRELDAVEGLAIAGLTRLTLGPKECLVLINGSQVSTALALRGLSAAMVAGSLTVDALKGSDAPLDSRIQALRGQQGQIDVAVLYRELMANSGIRKSHRDCKRVQARSQPQVMGARPDHLRFAQRVDPAQPGLPTLLVKEGGLNSGFMIAQVTAAARASENKSLAHPTSANQENHVSMATFAVRRLLDIACNSSEGGGCRAAGRRPGCRPAGFVEVGRRAANDPPASVALRRRRLLSPGYRRRAGLG